MGAVTTERRPVPGCRVHALGVIWYGGGQCCLVGNRLPDGFTADGCSAFVGVESATMRCRSVGAQGIRKNIVRSTLRANGRGFDAAVRARLG